MARGEATLKGNGEEGWKIFQASRFLSLSVEMALAHKQDTWQLVFVQVLKDTAAIRIAAS